jgi:NAD(P)-dependent dehydrogenase (short-subunit alcohol dehydrogenase family)
MATGASRGIGRAIATGYVDTGWISQPNDGEREWIKEQALPKRWGEPEDVARVAVFVASDDSSCFTGTTVLVDGGAALV